MESKALKVLMFPTGRDVRAGARSSAIDRYRINCTTLLGKIPVVGPALPANERRGPSEDVNFPDIGV